MRSCSSGGLLQAQTQLFDHLLAHQEFLDLAGDRHWKAIDEFNIARHLVMRDLALAKGPDFLGGRGLAIVQADPGAELLAIPRVGHTDHLHILDLRVAVEKLLDLARIDVLAAADHHVLDPPDDVAVALGVYGREIAGLHPAGRIDRLARLLLVIPVAEHDRIAASQQIARRAARHDPPLGIDDLYFAVRRYPSNCRNPPLDRIVGRALEAYRAGLGHAVSDCDLGQVHPLDRAFHDLDRARASGHDPGAQRGEIEFRKIRAVHLGDEHSRDAVNGCALFGRDRLEGSEWMKALARVDHGCAVRQAAEVAEHHAEAVIERHRDAEPVLLGEPHCLPDKETVVQDVVVAEGGAFRKTGRAAGELDVYRVIELQLFGERGETVP